MKNLIKVLISFALLFAFTSVFALEDAAVCPLVREIKGLTLIKAYSLTNNWWFVDADKFVSGGDSWKAFFSIGFDSQKTPEEALAAAKQELLNTKFLPAIGYSSQGITFCVFLNISKDKNFVVAVSPAFFNKQIQAAFKDAIKASA